MKKYLKIGYLIAVLAVMAVLAGIIFSPSASSEPPPIQPAPTEAVSKALPPVCTKVRASAWNKLVQREIAADGKTREHRRKTSVCLHPFNVFKHHVVKVERRNCVGQGVLCWIRKASIKYGIDYGSMVRVATCESGLDPGQDNSGGAKGLFQFLDSTWAGTPYAGYSVFSAKWNALAAAWLVRKDGGWSEWVCKP